MADYFYNKIKPDGWLKKQLKIQANGLSGNLDKVWRDVSDSQWIGGTTDGWERVPYWLDGFIPLAFLLDDEDMKKRAEFYINSILSRQEEDGWICPSNTVARKEYDSWAHILISKVLTLYYRFTHDDKVKQALYKATKCYYNLLSAGEIHLFDWGKFRWFEEFITLNFLYEDCKEEWIVSLGKILREQGADYNSFIDTWKEPKNEWTFHTHIVNLVMMFKYEALTSKLFGEEYKAEAEKLFEILEEYNGTAVGTFTGDECLSGTANNQGTELCSVVELMYSCELLYELTGNPLWADRLEKIAFNALPATISEDMWTHQYDQQVNQIGCVKLKNLFFGTNNNEAHLFGLEPNFGCCTANFNQGWPKFALNSFLRTEKGISCPVLLPASYETEINGVKVTVNCETEYPFEFFAKYTVAVEKPVDFELKIRVPGFAENIKLNGNDAEHLIVINKTWQGEESFNITFEDTVHFNKRENGLYYVQYGALVFSLPIDVKYEMSEYEKDGVARKFPYCDYELYPESEWRYGFAENNFTIQKNSEEIPFSVSKPKIILKAKMARVDWETAEGQEYISAKTPKSSKAISEAEELTLFPYGCAKLRMTEMPLCD